MDSSLLAKLFGILEATAGKTDGVALAEVASEVGLAKPTAHRILKQLVALGYMERLGPGRYRQTSRMRQLVSGDGDRRLTRAAEPALRSLWESTGETANLGVLRQGKVVYLSVLESEQPLRRSVSPTMTDPFASTALGRAIAAHLPADRLNYLLKTTPIERRTPCTVVDPDELRAILTRVRQQGYAEEEGETDLGVVCVGAAVFDRDSVAGAVSVSAPSVRATPKLRAEWAERVRGCAEAISARLRDSTEGD